MDCSSDLRDLKPVHRKTSEVFAESSTSPGKSAEILVLKTGFAVEQNICITVCSRWKQAGKYCKYKTEQEQHWRAQRWKWCSSSKQRQTQISGAEPALNASLSRCYLWISFPNYDPWESSESRVESAKCSRGRQLQNKNTWLCDHSTCRLCVDPLEEEQSWQRPGAGALLPASSLPSNPVLWLWGRQLTPLLQNKSPGLAERVFLWFSSQFNSLFCGLSLSVSPLNESQLLFTSY